MLQGLGQVDHVVALLSHTQATAIRRTYHVPLASSTEDIDAACQVWRKQIHSPESMSWYLLQVLCQIDDMATWQIPQTGYRDMQEVHHAPLLLHHVWLQHTQEVMPAEMYLKLSLGLVPAKSVYDSAVKHHESLPCCKRS